MGRVSINNRILTFKRCETDVSGEPPINLSDDTIFQFLSEESEPSSPVSDIEDCEIDEEKEHQDAGDDNFWETQHQLLENTIFRTSSIESKIRNITKETLKEAKDSGRICSCSKTFAIGCRKCLMNEVCCRLQNSGFNCAVCKSKWRSSPDIPSVTILPPFPGEHTFLEVMDDSNPKKGAVRVIIELNFQAEFEMARANEEYSKLVKRLPEIFVGKAERLQGVLKIICAAAKKCMKEKKMHLGPWRKHRYMQAKWLKTCDKVTSSQQLSPGYSGQPTTRPRKSLLTVDLMDHLSGLHRATVKVL